MCSLMTVHVFLGGDGWGKWTKLALLYFACIYSYASRIQEFNCDLRDLRAIWCIFEGHNSIPYHFRTSRDIAFKFGLCRSQEAKLCLLHKKLNFACGYLGSIQCIFKSIQVIIKLFKEWYKILILYFGVYPSWEVSIWPWWTWHNSV